MLISALCGVQLNLKVKPNTEKQYCKQSCAIMYWWSSTRLQAGLDIKCFAHKLLWLVVFLQS